MERNELGNKQLNILLQLIVCVVIAPLAYFKTPSLDAYRAGLALFANVQLVMAWLEFGF